MPVAPIAARILGKFDAPPKTALFFADAAQGRNSSFEALESIAAFQS